MDSTLFQRIENAVDDLEQADEHSFYTNMKTLSRLLHSESLQPIGMICYMESIFKPG